MTVKIEDSLNLENRHILISGASSGLGRATAELASALGARVSLMARRENELKETLASLSGEGHSLWVFDLAQLEAIEDKIKEITAVQGPFDGLVHCAGLGNPRPLNMIKPDFLLSMMAVNFNAFVELVRSISKKKHSNEGASLVGVSSVAAFCGGKSQGSYAASKAALQGIIPAMAKELAPRGIRVNAAAFGQIKAGMYSVFKDSGLDEEALLARQYLGLGEPLDAARVLCFLLSDYSRFISGTVLKADGGFLS